VELLTYIRDAVSFFILFYLFIYFGFVVFENQVKGTLLKPSHSKSLKTFQIGSLY
jgi:hypothetical protein